MGDMLRFFPEVDGVRGLGPRKPCRRGIGAARWYDRGLTLEASDPAEAIFAYTRALAGNPRHCDAHCNLGRLLHERCQLAAAEAHYRLALCSDASVGLYWFNLGVA